MEKQQTSVDFVGKGTSQGPLANQLSGGRLNLGGLRPFVDPKDGKTYMTVYVGGNPKNPANYQTIQSNAKGTLRRDEWLRLDEALVNLAESRLDGVQDLINRGLTYNLGNAMGTTVLESHDISDAMEAELSMDAVSRSKGDRVEYGQTFLPIPIIHVDYEINQRVLEASRKLGNPLDTASAERAARKVMEKRESMLFTDMDYSFGNGKISSFVNYANRVSPAGTGDKKIANISDWGSAAVSGEEIVDDVLAMKKALIGQHYYGPYVLYIPTTFETKLDEDYSSAKGSKTIRQRILDINNISDIVVVDKLPADNVVMVQLSTDVVRIVQGMSLQNIQWETQGGFVNKFKAIAIQVPQIRSDAEGHTGIVHNYPATT